MHLSRVFLGGALIAAPSIAVGQPQPLGPLWQNARGSIILTKCPPGGDHDDNCRAVIVESGSKVVPLGGGYEHVTLLWARKTGVAEPDALVLGDYGGSGGDADLFAVRLSRQVSFRKLGGERYDTVTVSTKPGPLSLNIPFDIEYFNGAPHAGAIVLPLPVLWSSNGFVADVRKLTRRSYSKSELDFRVLAMRQELAAWAQDKYPATRIYPPNARDGTPVAATSIIEMMLSGHADQARSVLDRAWPRQWGHGDRELGGKAAFWGALCGSVIAEPSWKRFNLAQLPHANLIEQGAGKKDEEIGPTVHLASSARL